MPNPSQDDCDGVGVGDACESPMAASGVAAGKKNRYVSFVPSNHVCAMAFKVTLIESAYHPESVGLEKWLTAPEDSTGIVQLVNAPVYTVWPDMMIHIGDCEVIPVSQYEIRSIVAGKDTSVAANYSTPLLMRTIDRPGENYWADVAAPAGVADIRDIAALVDCFKGLPTALPLTVCDVAPETPDRIVNILDVAAGVDGFKGMHYPYSAPANCP